jgi:hypothetical protein
MMVQTFSYPNVNIRTLVVIVGKRRKKGWIELILFHCAYRDVHQLTRLLVG